MSEKPNTPLWVLSHRPLPPLHSPWGPALPEALTSQTGPGGNEADNMSPGQGSPQSHPSLRTLSLPPAYPGSLLSTGSRKTRKSQGPLVKMKKEKLRSQEMEGPRKGQRG